MKFEDIPEWPENHIRYNGEPPYQNGGYVIDAMVNGHMTRWRYDNKGLMAFIVYGKEYLIPWIDSWFRENER